MYNLTIKTKYNVINIAVDDYNAPEVQEILEQPYVEEVRIEKQKVKEEAKPNEKRLQMLHMPQSTKGKTNKAC